MDPPEVIPGSRIHNLLKVKLFELGVLDLLQLQPNDFLFHAQGLFPNVASRFIQLNHLRYQVKDNLDRGLSKAFTNQASRQRW